VPFLREEEMKPVVAGGAIPFSSVRSVLRRLPKLPDHLLKFADSLRWSRASADYVSETDSSPPTLLRLITARKLSRPEGD
jgi:hypothetical protein